MFMLPGRPPNAELVLIHVRMTGMEYLGRIHQEELEEPYAELAGYLLLYDYVFCNCVVQPNGEAVIPMILWPKGEFWENPIFIPKQQATIMIVTPGGMLWNAYGKKMGNLITLHGNLPTNMPPPPGVASN